MDKKHEVIDWIISNLITIFLAFPTISTFIYSVWGFLTKSFSVLDIIIIAFLFVTYGVLALRAFWNKRDYHAYHYPWVYLKTSCNFETIDKTVSYSRDETDSLRYSRTVTVKSLANRLDSIKDKYIWTGIQGNSFTPKPHSGVSTIQLLPVIGVWQYFEIKFKNTINKGKTTTIEYIWPEIRNCSKSSPFFSASTDEPTKALTLKLSLGKEYANQAIICEEYRSIESNTCIQRQEARLDENGVYNWPISDIKRFRYYQIRWNWTVGGAPAEIYERT